jgi:hypothetical protein
MTNKKSENCYDIKGNSEQRRKKVFILDKNLMRVKNEDLTPDHFSGSRNSVKNEDLPFGFFNMFQRTAEKKVEAITNCDHLSRLMFSPANKDLIRIWNSPPSDYAALAFFALAAGSLDFLAVA